MHPRSDELSFVVPCLGLPLRSGCPAVDDVDSVNAIILYMRLDTNLADFIFFSLIKFMIDGDICICQRANTCEGRLELLLLVRFVYHLHQSK